MRIIYHLLLVIPIFSLNACTDKHSPAENKQLIENILTNIKQVETANYISTKSAYTVYDTMKPVHVSDHYFKEYTNPTDTFVGVSFVRLSINDTTKMEYCYDGAMRVRVHWEEETMEIDSFRTQRFPWREVLSPFFTGTKAILEYMNETSDSISYKVNDFGDSLAINIIIYDTINSVDFLVGNQPIYFPQVKNVYEMDFSRYTIWVSKTDYLPYKIKRDLPHSISIERVKNVQINNDKISNFSAKSYFPDFPLREKSNNSVSKNLKGTKAPIWSLRNTKNEIVSLEDFKGKIVLVEFTGIGCGPCHAAIPFLKQLVNDYDKAIVEVISIETWSKDLNTIKRYQEKQKLNFKILKSDNLVEKQYDVQSVPQFYMLDRNHEIVDIIRGYSVETTDEKIRELIKYYSL